MPCLLKPANMCWHGNQLLGLLYMSPCGVQAPNEAALCYKEKWEEWAAQHGVQVRGCTAQQGWCTAQQGCVGWGACCRVLRLAAAAAAAVHLSSMVSLINGAAVRRARAGPASVGRCGLCPKRGCCGLRPTGAAVASALKGLLPHSYKPPAAVCQVITSTRDSFSDMFDDDQTLM